jgi:hypothetical protein
MRTRHDGVTVQTDPSGLQRREAQLVNTQETDAGQLLLPV